MPEDFPFFSLCVPTRNRSYTLYYCLKTLLDQDFEDYEIIISDNSDQIESEENQQILKELTSEKIRYFKQDKILSMAHNFEFALSKVRGKFVMCMGDDDGLLVNSLQYVFDFINKYKAEVVKCAEIVYWWPGSTVYPQSQLAFPIERPVTQVMSKSILEKVINFELSYFNLPMLYYSFVSTRIIKEVIKEKGSFFQDAASIDMYSGFIIAYKTDSFFITDKTFVIPGLSSKSTGESASQSFQNNVAKEFLSQHNLVEDYEKFKIPFPSKFSLSIFVWLELSKFIKNFNLEELYFINYNNIFVECMIGNNDLNSEVLKPFKNNELYKEDIIRIENNFRGDNAFYLKTGFHNTSTIQNILVDPRMFSINDIYGASVLSKNIIESRKKSEPVFSNPLPIQISEKRRLPQIVSRFKKAWKVIITGNY